MTDKIILSSLYFPPIQYFAQILSSSEIYIESKANYVKQTYLNRCEILAANGKLTLSIPIKKSKTRKIKIEDVELSYDTDWQRLHLKSIESAYRSSAFYEYYIDALLPFFSKKYKFLLEFNSDLLKVLLNELEIDVNINFTDEYYENQFEALDARFKISPKNIENIEINVNLPQYYQVFAAKHGFLPNLSILDLLFNEGPNSRLILKGKR